MCSQPQSPGLWQAEYFRHSPHSSLNSELVQQDRKWATNTSGYATPCLQRYKGRCCCCCCLLLYLLSPRDAYFHSPCFSTISNSVWGEFNLISEIYCGSNKGLTQLSSHFLSLYHYISFSRHMFLFSLALPNRIKSLSEKSCPMHSDLSEDFSAWKVRNLIIYKLFFFFFFLFPMRS